MREGSLEKSTIPVPPSASLVTEGGRMDLLKASESIMISRLVRKEGRLLAGPSTPIFSVWIVAGSLIAVVV